MRADYMEKTGNDVSEEEKLDSHWTENWESIGNKRRASWRIKAGPEYSVVREFAPKSGKDVRVLDGGCGLGEWCLLLKDLGYEPHGLDISTPTVNALNKEFPDMHFVRDDIRQTSFEEAFFDFYISWGTFEHFENGLQDCFGEAKRVLKPGGKLIITVPFYNDRLKYIDAVSGKPEKGDNEFYQWRLEESELAEEFDKGGFDIDLVKPIYTREGLGRHLHHRYGLPYGRATRLLSMAMAPFAPASRFAHMLIGVGTRR